MNDMWKTMIEALEGRKAALVAELAQINAVIAALPAATKTEPEALAPLAPPARFMPEVIRRRGGSPPKAGVSQREMVLNMLSVSPLTSGQIVSHFNPPQRDSVRTVLSELRRAGKVVGDVSGVYSLAKSNGANGAVRA
jgi:hypothetical protein